MSTAPHASIDALVAGVSRVTGFQREAIRAEALYRALAEHWARGRTVIDVVDALARGDADLFTEVSRALAVGETFFFRHPEHFTFIATTVVPALLKKGAKHIRAWSAGCATGEETYSLAACLVATAGSASVDVLGTDWLDRNVAAARLAEYRPWSLRASAPLLYPMMVRADDERFTVAATCKDATRFAQHNLLTAAPETGFDLILCRNVMVYFHADAIRAACRHLAQALAPGGVLIVGTMDTDETPKGLTPLQTAPRIKAFVRQEATSAPPPRAKKAPAAAAPAPAPVEMLPEPVVLHLRALVAIEKGDIANARSLLARLVQTLPDYLPALMEHALLAARLGDVEMAKTAMRTLLTRASALPPDALIAGPEALPLSFYTSTATAFLGRSV